MLTTALLFVLYFVLGTSNLLNSGLKFGADKFRFCHVSTDEVYGQLKENDPAFTETHQICPSSPYSASKASSDLLVNSYFETFNMDTVMTRCSNNYSPYQFPEKLISVMIAKALSGENIPVYGDGRNIRNWIFVNDHNTGVWNVFKSGKSGEVYNLGGDSEKKNIEVVKTILEQLGKSEKLISFVEDRKGHDWRYAINFEKAQSELGWTPKTSFEDGMRKTINWYTEN